jgi:transcriptional regulator with XRE-family HTH domain
MTHAAATAADLWEPRTMGERIRRLRERAGMKQEDLAKAMEALGVPVTQGHISRFERYGSGDPRARKPQWVHLCALAEIFDVRFSDLGATEEEYPELRFLRHGSVTRAKLKSNRLRIHPGGRTKPPAAHQPPIVVAR